MLTTDGIEKAEVINGTGSWVDGEIDQVEVGQKISVNE